MIYTDIALLAFFVSILADLYLLRNRLIFRKVYWTGYAIIIFFQLLTNWWLTSRNIVMYNPESIIGIRVASAPVEDLFFGFALVLLVQNMWVFWGKKPNFFDFFYGCLSFFPYLCIHKKGKNEPVRRRIS